MFCEIARLIYFRVRVDSDPLLVVVVLLCGALHILEVSVLA